MIILHLEKPGTEKLKVILINLNFYIEKRKCLTAFTTTLKVCIKYRNRVDDLSKTRRTSN